MDIRILIYILFEFLCLIVIFVLWLEVSFCNFDIVVFEGRIIFENFFIVVVEGEKNWIFVFFLFVLGFL